MEKRSIFLYRFSISTIDALFYFVRFVHHYDQRYLISWTIFKIDDIFKLIFLYENT